MLHSHVRSDAVSSLGQTVEHRQRCPFLHSLPAAIAFGQYSSQWILCASRGAMWRQSRTNLVPQMLTKHIINFQLAQRPLRTGTPGSRTTKGLLPTELCQPPVCYQSHSSCTQVNNKELAVFSQYNRQLDRLQLTDNAYVHHIKLNIKECYDLICVCSVKNASPA